MIHGVKFNVAWGVDIGGTNITVGLVDLLAGQVIATERFSVRRYKSFASVVRRIATVCRKLEQNTSTAPTAMGIGCPGIVDEAGIVLKSPNMPILNGNNLREALTAELNVPVYLENDANAAAAGESFFGKAKGCRDFVFLTLGTGVGGGVISGGQLLTGSLGMAAEVGHIKISHDGPVCGCGKQGCLEAYVGASAILRQANRLPIQVPVGVDGERSESAEFTSVADVARAARQGNKVLLELFDELGVHLGLGTATLIEILNPEKILIGGGVSNAWDLFYDSLQTTLNDTCSFDTTLGHVLIDRAAQSDHKAILGAAALTRYHDDASNAMTDVSGAVRVCNANGTSKGRSDYYLCLQLGASSFRAGVLSHTGQVIASNSSFAPFYARSELTDEELLAELTTAAEEVILESGVDVGELKGVGFIVPTPLNSRMGDVRRPPNLKVQSDFTRRLQLALQRVLGRLLPVLVGNDANGACLAEHFFGCAKDVSDLFLVRLCTGIGAGMLLDGKLYLGAGRAAGEFGHYTVHERGRQCGCGNKGCLETVASGRALVERAAELKIPFESDANKYCYLGVLEAARKGSGEAKALLEDMGHYLGIALAAVADILNPGLIVLSGPLGDAFDLFGEAMQTQFCNRVFPGLDCEIRVSGLTEPSELLAALSTVLYEQECYHA